MRPWCRTKAGERKVLQVKKAMPDWTRVWRVIIPLALIVLVLATTMGMVWHHHDRYSADRCTLCHLAIAPAVEQSASQGLATATPEHPVKQQGFVSRCAADEKPARAPPV